MNDVRKILRRDALYFLSRREHSYHELLQKLHTKHNLELSTISPVLNELVQENLLSDQRFTENYIHFRRNKGYGPVRIRLELIEKGISEELIEEHLNFTDNAWNTLAAAVRKKRFKNSTPKDFKTRAKEIRFLIYRGFTQNHIEHLYKHENYA